MYLLYLNKIFEIKKFYSLNPIEYVFAVFKQNFRNCILIKNFIHLISNKLSN